jgi:NAD(P)-dependent dehydrogenase (short-subunit alcohol dehydrogenase family)
MSEDRGVLIVTGGGRSIGAAVARRAALDGYAVAINYSRSAEKAEALAAEITAAGGRAAAIQGDVAIEADVLRLFADAEAQLGPITALVNNAGITGGYASVDAVSAETITRVLAVNVTGTLLCSREAVKRMSTKHGGSGGAIVNLSSMAAKLGSPGEWVHYAASKGAIDTYTIGLAREVGPDGIRVNAVRPGLIESDIHADNGDPERPARLAPTVPMRRSGSAEEVAEGIVWLLSPAASYITGAILDIGGGR